MSKKIISIDKIRSILEEHYPIRVHARRNQKLFGREENVFKWLETHLGGRAVRLSGETVQYAEIDLSCAYAVYAIKLEIGWTVWFKNTRDAMLFKLSFETISEESFNQSMNS